MTTIRKGMKVTVVISDSDHEELQEGTVHGVTSMMGSKDDPTYQLSTGWYAKKENDLLCISTPEKILAILDKPDT